MPNTSFFPNALSHTQGIYYTGTLVFADGEKRDVDAAVIADRIRERVQSDSVEPGQPSEWPGPVTLSMGLASFPGDATRDDLLLAHAQAQLQSVSRTGRPPS